MTSMISKRAFLGSLAGGLVAAPLAAKAQTRGLQTLKDSFTRARWQNEAGLQGVTVDVQFTPGGTGTIACGAGGTGAPSR
jgi:hypothetical protein